MSGLTSKKVLAIGFVFILAIIILFGAIYVIKSRTSSENSNGIISLSRDKLLQKYPFVAGKESGVRQSPNFTTKIDIWGTFEKVEGNMFWINVNGELLQLPLPADQKVFKGARNPEDFVYLNISDVEKGVGVIVTINQAEKPYKIESIQIPFH